MSGESPEDIPFWLQVARLRAKLNDPDNPYYAIPFRWFLAYGRWRDAPVWHHEQWLRLHRALTPFAKSCSGRMAGRAEVVERASPVQRPKEIRLGRLGWAPGLQRKWTFGGEGALNERDHRLYGVTFSCPGPTVQRRERRPPDFFLDVHDISWKVPGMMAIFFVVREEIFDANLRHATALVSTLRSLFVQPEFGQLHDSWCHRANREQPLNQDFDAWYYLTNGLGNAIVGQAIPTIESLDERWVRIPDAAHE